MTRSHLFLALLLVSCWRGLAAADWNQWRGPNRDGVAPAGPALIERLPGAGLQPLWIADQAIPAARNGGWSSPIVADGRVYLFTHSKTRLKEGAIPPQQYPWLAPEKRGGMSDEEYAEYERRRRDEDEARAAYFRYDEITYCLEAATGKLLWSNQRSSNYTRFFQSGSPTVIDGRLFVLGAGRTARCIHAVSGEDLWQTRLPGEFRDEFLQSSIAVADGAAVVLCGWLFGLDAVSGKVLWQGDPVQTRGVHTSPVVWDAAGAPLVIVNVGGGDTICVQPRTGVERWRVRSDGGNSTPVLAGHHLITYGSSRKKGLRCFRITRDKAEHLWTFTGAADPGSSPVVVDGHVYVQGDRRLACVDLAGGQAQWTTSLDLAQPRYTSLAAADGKIFYTFDNVLCFAASADGFSQLINGIIDNAGLLADEESFRKLLDIESLEATAEGKKEAQRIWRKKFNNSGPLPCASPAIADGRLFLRLKSGLACYDLTVSSAE